MPDYKDTLNLPKTNFPMKGNLSQHEPEILAFWEKLGLYGKQRKQMKGRPTFILHDGPPYANGNIHLGHALNKTLKDIIVKSKMMSGFNAPYVPGWDCHGLPIELNVEKKIGKAGDKVSSETFREACRNYAIEQVNIQREEFKRLGVMGDWDNPYLTVDFYYEANVIRSLAKVVKNGHLVHGRKPVHWCIDCGSALAEAEVEYQDKTSLAMDVRFRVVDKAALERCFKNIKINGSTSVLIWTTTPWTLPANQAVALHPKVEYALVSVNNENVLIAKSLVESAMMRYGFNQYQIIATCLGKTLEGFILRHPFLDRVVPIVLGDHVTIETGTGAVHTAPAHGQDDYIIGQHYDLPSDNPVGDNGCFLSHVPLFAGEHVFKVDDHIIKVLKENNNLLKLDNFQHSYPHCWRHKKPLIFHATPQWFISMDQNELRKHALKAIEQVTWLPEWGKARISSMVAERPDWCISRQRAWGTPIPLFAHRKTGELHPDTLKLMEGVAKLIEKKGVEAWYKLEAKKLLGDDAKHYEKTSDTLDVWFDSGVTHACVLAKRPELKVPADLYLEGSDQHRGWFQSSLLSAIAMHGKAPYKTVLTHGFTTDDEGRKMSKSVGNVILPEKIINTLGADILRLWVSSTDYRGEVVVSNEVFKRNSDVYRRLRNTARFLLANTSDFNPKKHQVMFKDMLALDRWAIDRARLLQEQIKQAYDSYQFHQIYHKIHHFFVVDMGGFYLDVIKDRQYTMPAESLGRRSAQTAMYHILETIVRWLAPILSFTAEEIWQHMPGKREESVFLTTWYKGLGVLNEKELMNQAYWEQVICVRNEVNKEIEKQRNGRLIGSALAVDVNLYCNNSLKKSLSLLGDELRFVLITSSAEILSDEEKPADAVETSIAGLHLIVTPSTVKKCVRCWHYQKNVGSDKKHPELCARCVENISGKGEERRYA